MSWLSGWNCRKSHDIKGSSAGEVTDYQIRITVHYGEGTDSGEHVYLGGLCRSDFGDIRFTESDGVTELPYWMERKVDGDYAIFWVKIPSIPASPDTVTIYIYFDNSSATTTSNGDDTFIHFDALDNLSDFQSKWTKQSGDDAELDTSSYYLPTIKIPDTSDTGSTIYYKDVSLPTTYCWVLNIYMTAEASPQNPYARFELRRNDDACILFGCRGGDINKNAVYGSGGYREFGTYEQNTLWRWSVRIDPVNRRCLRVDVEDGDSYTTAISYATDADINRLRMFGVGGGNTGASWFTKLFIRKFIDPEPSHDAWGDLECLTPPETPISAKALYKEFVIEQPVTNHLALYNALGFEETPISAKALYNMLGAEETPISVKALYNKLGVEETPISVKALYNKLGIEEVPISVKALYNTLSFEETPISVKALYNELGLEETPIRAKLLCNRMGIREIPISAKVLCNIKKIEVPEYVIGLTYDAWVFKSTTKQWYKDGIVNPPGIPTNDMGVQWGLHIWSIRRKQWLLG